MLRCICAEIPKKSLLWEPASGNRCGIEKIVPMEGITMPEGEVCVDHVLLEIPHFTIFYYFQYKPG